MSDQTEQNSQAANVGQKPLFLINAVFIAFAVGLSLWMHFYSKNHSSLDHITLSEDEIASIQTTGETVAVAAGGSDELKKGKTLYATCVACHGANGEGNIALKAPSLVGQSDWYLTAQIKKFKEGHRGTHPKDATGASMRTMAMTLADDQAIADVVKYITTLDAPLPEPTLEGDAEKGKASYAICLACHGADGKGNKALNSPALVNLNDWYIVAQLHKFKDGIRGGDPKDVTGAQMRPMAMTLPDEEAMKNIAAYINTLRSK